MESKKPQEMLIVRVFTLVPREPLIMLIGLLRTTSSVMLEPLALRWTVLSWPSPRQRLVSEGRIFWSKLQMLVFTRFRSLRVGRARTLKLASSRPWVFRAVNALRVGSSSSMAACGQPETSKESISMLTSLRDLRLGAGKRKEFVKVMLVSDRLASQVKSQCTIPVKEESWTESFRRPIGKLKAEQSLIFDKESSLMPGVWRSNWISSMEFNEREMREAEDMARDRQVELQEREIERLGAWLSLIFKDLSFLREGMLTQEISLPMSSRLLREGKSWSVKESRLVWERLSSWRLDAQILSIR